MDIFPDSREVDYRTITLIFPDGQEFPGSILPKHFYLRDFIEDLISRLERERKLNLLYHEGLFTESNDFMILDPYTQSLVNLDLMLEFDPYISEMLRSNCKIEFWLQSNLFKSVDTDEIEESPYVAHYSIPIRQDSKINFLLSKCEITFLAGLAQSILRSSSNPNSLIYCSDHSNESFITQSFGDHSSMYKLHKSLIDLGLVKLPLLYFDTQSDTTSQWSIASIPNLSNTNHSQFPTSLSHDFVGECFLKQNPLCDNFSPTNFIQYTFIFPDLKVTPKPVIYLTDYFLVDFFYLRISLPPFSYYDIIFIECLKSHTIGQIMTWLREYVFGPKNTSQNSDESISPDKLMLTYKISNNYFELYDECMVLSMLNEVTSPKLYDQSLHLHLIEKTPISDELRRFDQIIGSLISFGLYNFDLSNNSEIVFSRRKFDILRRKSIHKRDPYCFQMPIFTNNFDLFDGISCIRYVKIYNDYITKVLQINLHLVSPEMLLEQFFDKLGLPKITSKQFVLRTFHKINFLHGKDPLLYFSCIQKTMINEKNILEFVVVPKEFYALSPLTYNILEENVPTISGVQNIAGLHHSQVANIALYQMTNFFRIRIYGIDNLRNIVPGIVYLYLEIFLLHGGILLCESKHTNRVPISNYPRWNNWIQFCIPVRNLPREARIHFKLKGTYDKLHNVLHPESFPYPTFSKQDIVLQSVNFQIFDHRAILQTGKKKLNLWPSLEIGNRDNNADLNYLYGVKSGDDLMTAGSPSINSENLKSAFLILEFDDYIRPIECTYRIDSFSDETIAPELDPGAESFLIERILSKGNFNSLTSVEKDTLQKYSFYCSQRPYALPMYLLSINWADPVKIGQCHYLLSRWSPITLDIALNLLSYNFADAKVRNLGVKYLESLKNGDLILYLLQLVQVLKFECFHDNPLSQLLLDRALSCRVFGHYYFWYLRAEIETCQYRERFSILLEAYLKGCDSDLLSCLSSQVSFIKNVTENYRKVMFNVQFLDETVNAVENIRYHISQIQIPEKFCPLYDPLVSVNKIDVSKIKIMDSKKRPLWLEFINNDSFSKFTNIKILVKIGDDLRQDMLIIQMLRIMENIWLVNGLDLHLIPYGCLSTGFEVGIIEIIQHAVTVCNIQREAKVNILETFQKEVLLNWLQNLNPEEEQLIKAKEKFLYSCAGYCVATYILGIGDRHNDNIMVCEDGNLFHIDFGHFLGNRKKKLGFNREPVPFILTPDFIHVLGGIGCDNFKYFIKICVDAYQIIRKHSNLFITLFTMMKYTGMPELRSESDIAYLKEVLTPNLSSDEASSHFMALIQRSIENSLQVQISWHFHMKCTN